MPVVDNMMALANKLQKTIPEDHNAQNSESKDDHTEKKNEPDLETVDRFDTQKKNSCAFTTGVISGTVSFNRETNTVNIVTRIKSVFLVRSIF